MTRWITVSMLALLIAPMAFAQTLSEAEYLKLKEQIKREVIEELKAEYNLVPKNEPEQATSTEAPTSTNTAIESRTKTDAPQVETPVKVTQPKAAPKVTPTLENDSQKTTPEKKIDNRSREERMRDAKTG